MELRWHASLEALKYTFYQEKLNHEAELQSLPEEVKELRTAMLWLADDGPCTRPHTKPPPDLEFLARACRISLQDADVDPCAAALLQGPLQSHNIAQALEMTRQAFELANQKIFLVEAYGDSPPHSTWNALRHLRDLLILQMCAGAGPWTHVSLKQQLEDIFNKPIDTRLQSQLFLSFNKIIQLASDRDEFDNFVTNSYGDALSPAEADQLFAAYTMMARGSPEYVSESKLHKTIRPPKKNKNTRTYEGDAEDGQPRATADATDASGALNATDAHGALDALDVEDEAHAESTGTGA